MSFGGIVGKAKATPALPHETGDEEEGDARGEGGFLRMLGRGRKETGTGGRYEMMRMEEGDENA